MASKTDRAQRKKDGGAVLPPRRPGLMRSPAFHAATPRNDDQLLRYSRHILLDEIGVEAGTHPGARIADRGRRQSGGSPAALPGLDGVGRLTLVDDDVVDLTNLQRQSPTTERVGQSRSSPPPGPCTPSTWSACALRSTRGYELWTGSWRNRT